MLRRFILMALIAGMVTGAAGFWLLWASPGPKPGPHRITVEEGATLVTGGLGRPDVGPDRDVHADEAGDAGQDRTDQEGDGAETAEEKAQG